MSRPLALTDAQFDAIYRAAEPLAPADRSPFLEACATALQGQPVLGDGIVHRVCAEQQRKFFDPPDLSRAHDASKYR